MSESNRGFSIISVLLALVLLAVGISALSGAGAQVFRVHTTMGARSAALAIARSHMELVRGQNPEDLASESSVKVDKSGRLDPSGAFARSVEVENVRHNLKRVKVVVEFPRSDRPVEIETLAFISNSGS